MNKAEKTSKDTIGKYIVIRKFVGKKSAEEIIIQMLKAHTESK